jgi:hypothetical protein
LHTGDQETISQTPLQNPTLLPKELHNLLNSPDIQLRARLKQDGVFYTSSTVHLGNSLVYYYCNGNRQLPPTPGQIQHIFVQGQQYYFVLLPHKPAPNGTSDPFRFYDHIPIKIYSVDLAEKMEIIQVEWVFGHCARWSISTDLVAIVSLSRVCASSSFIFYFIYIFLGLTASNYSCIAWV